MGMSQPRRPASKDGMYYMSGTPSEVLGGGVDDLIGGGLNLEDEIKREVARQAATQAIQAIKDQLSGFFGFHPGRMLKTALHASARPFTYQANLANRLVHGAAHMRLPGEGGGGGGGAAPPPPDAPAPDGGDGADQSAPEAAAEGVLMGMLQAPGGLSQISTIEGMFPGTIARLAQRMRHRGRMRGHHQGGANWRSHASAAAGFSLNPAKWFHAVKPAGKLLVSATPGGTTALQAHAIANKALKSGALKPQHLKKAAALTKAGRKGDDKALVKIASIKAAANRGDPHAMVALDRIKLAHCLQTGKPCRGGGGALSQSYSVGLRVLASRR